MDEKFVPFKKTFELSLQIKVVHILIKFYNFSRFAKLVDITPNIFKE